jgi:hypothetical protein
VQLGAFPALPAGRFVFLCGSVNYILPQRPPRIAQSNTMTFWTAPFIFLKPPEVQTKYDKRIKQSKKVYVNNYVY